MPIRLGNKSDGNAATNLQDVSFFEINNFVPSNDHLLQAANAWCAPIPFAPCNSVSQLCHRISLFRSARSAIPQAAASVCQALLLQKTEWFCHGSAMVLTAAVIPGSIGATNAPTVFQAVPILLVTQVPFQFFRFGQLVVSRQPHPRMTFIESVPASKKVIDMLSAVMISVSFSGWQQVQLPLIDCLTPPQRKTAAAAVCMAVICTN